MSEKRERPMVTGKDAERFMEMVRKNNEYIKKRRESRNKDEKLIDLVNNPTELSEYTKECLKEYEQNNK
jgi:hypothetical protein